MVSVARVCPLEIASDMSAFRAVIGDHAIVRKPSGLPIQGPYFPALFQSRGPNSHQENQTPRQITERLTPRSPLELCLLPPVFLNDYLNDSGECDVPTFLSAAVADARFLLRARTEASKMPRSRHAGRTRFRGSLLNPSKPPSVGEACRLQREAVRPMDSRLAGSDDPRVPWRQQRDCRAIPVASNSERCRRRTL